VDEGEGFKKLRLAHLYRQVIGKVQQKLACNPRLVIESAAR